MTHDQFTELFKHIEAKFAELHTELSDTREGLHKDIQRVYDLVDSLAVDHVTDEQELLALTGQVSRHDSWFQQLARKTGLDLK